MLSSHPDPAQPQSPQGPESGTCTSLKAKLPYLEDLGITGIWLAGHAPADSHHFFNVWSAYAVIDISKLDLSLGTPEEFRDLIREAHRRGIKVFWDVVTHGVMNSSPLIQEHPHWFRGGTWGMTDYDWYGGHTDLDDWGSRRGRITFLTERDLTDFACMVKRDKTPGGGLRVFKVEPNP